MNEQIAKPLLRIAHPKHGAVHPPDHARVADLPAGFTVERRLVQNESALTSRRQPFPTSEPFDTIARISPSAVSVS